MSEKKGNGGMSRRFSRREALKRMAKTTGQISILAAFPSWVLGGTLSDKSGRAGGGLAYSSWYGSYGSYYGSYGSFYSSSYSSYRGAGYSSYAYSSYGGAGATCFIDTLKKRK